jgi:hypothetical protein
MVWFCVSCDDQAPWQNEERVHCPSCHEIGRVIPAARFRSFGAQLNDSLAQAQEGCGPCECGGGGCA